MTMTMEDITLKGTDYHTALTRARDECLASGQNRYVCRTMLVDDSSDLSKNTFIFKVIDDGYIRRHDWPGAVEIVARFEGGNKRRWWESTIHSIGRNLDEELPSQHFGSIEWSGKVHIGTY